MRHSIAVLLLVAIGGEVLAVTVTGDAPIIDTQQSGISSVVTSREVERLPAVRNFQEIVRLTPRVASPMPIEGFNKVNVAAGTGSEIWFAGEGNGRIGFFDAGGSQGSITLGFTERIEAISIDTNFLAAIDLNRNSVLLFDTQRRMPINEFRPSTSNAFAPFSGITYSPSDRHFWAAMTEAGKLFKIDPNFSLMAEIPLPGGLVPTQLDAFNGGVEVTTQRGIMHCTGFSCVERSMVPPGTFPTGIACSDRYGCVFGDFERSRIHWFDPNDPPAATRYVTQALPGPYYVTTIAKDRAGSLYMNAAPLEMGQPETLYFVGSRRRRAIDR